MKMESKKIAAWKVATVREWVKQKELHPNSNIDWSTIVEAVEKVDKGVFAGVSSPGRKLSDFIKRNPALVEKIVAGLSGSEEEKKAKEGAKKASSGSRAKATTAHVYDEDRDTEEEVEVVKSVDLREVKKNKDGSYAVDVEITDTMENLMDETYLLKKLGYDPLVWEVVSSSCRKGQWEAQTKEGDIKTLHSYRVNANVKKRDGSICESALLDAFLSHMNRKKADKPVYKVEKQNGENIAIISIADLHLGKLAWHRECGDNYDYHICRERYFFIINEAITYLKKVENLEKVIFFWAQDFFHYDSLRITTTAGTQQDTDVRWQKLFQTGCEMLVDGIQLIRDELNVPVQTFYTRSNHDMQVSFYALHYLYAFFHNDDMVSVDRSPMGRKYIEYGINLMGFGHGDEEKKRIHQLMQIEEREAWGRTYSHEWFLGHFHKQMVNDESGVTARYLASPTGTDAWHYTEGYVGAMRQAQVFVRNKYSGPTDEHIINILE